MCIQHLPDPTSWSREQAEEVSRAEEGAGGLHARSGVERGLRANCEGSVSQRPTLLTSPALTSRQRPGVLPQKPLNQRRKRGPEQYTGRVR